MDVLRVQDPQPDVPAPAATPPVHNPGCKLAQAGPAVQGAGPALTGPSRLAERRPTLEAFDIDPTLRDRLDGRSLPGMPNGPGSGAGRSSPTGLMPVSSRYLRDELQKIESRLRRLPTGTPYGAELRQRCQRLQHCAREPMVTAEVMAEAKRLTEELATSTGVVLLALEKAERTDLRRLDSFIESCDARVREALQPRADKAHALHDEARRCFGKGMMESSMRTTEQVRGLCAATLQLMVNDRAWEEVVNQCKLHQELRAGMSQLRQSGGVALGRLAERFDRFEAEFEYALNSDQMRCALYEMDELVRTARQLNRSTDAPDLPRNGQARRPSPRAPAAPQPPTPH
ncbi:hypothetical protein [Roseateles amylovorans]|uniref:Uncharacterized protein n=1 Tax=Roseateles amylovorans TaxID=2978473 RepID=A0ABY6B5U4_9BURK|nr:hypothetical protein [Roseateles amylovorans]UXH80545.1 hypothetical protein N4261_12005 [Roseateles amylovorans]